MRWLCSLLVGALIAVWVTPSAAAAPKIAAVGDMGCDGGHNHWSANTCHQRAVSDLVFRHGYDAFLPLGDNQYECGSKRDFHRVYGPTFGRLKRITHPVVGNHEYWAGAGYQGVSARDRCDLNATGYYHYFGKRAHRTDTAIEGVYRYRIGHWLLLAMNSECSYGAGNTPPCWRQTQWLANRLRHNHARCELVYMHKPPVYVGGGAGVTKPFLEVFARYRGDVLLAGHDHLFAAWKPYRGVRQFTVGTGGKSLTGHGRPDGRVAYQQGTAFGVLSLRLFSHGYRWRFVPARGDSWTRHGRGRC